METKIGNYTIIKNGKLIDFLDEKGKSVCWFNENDIPAVIKFLNKSVELKDIKENGDLA